MRLSESELQYLYSTLNRYPSQTARQIQGKIATRLLKARTTIRYHPGHWNYQN